MEVARIRSALAEIERELDRARIVKRQIENDSIGRSSPDGNVEDPKAALGEILTALYELVLVVLEAAGLPETRNRMLQKQRYFERTGGMSQASYDHQYDYLESKPYDYITSLVDGLRCIAGDEHSPKDSYELAQLEKILRNTAVLVRARRTLPTREHDVQEVMHDYLSAFFIEYTRSVRIHGVIRNFDPDGGVRNLRTAIEFKYATSRTEVSKAIGGIFEDLSGYSGSHDWTQFYTVIYQTEAFESEARFKSELNRTGVVNWKAILVTGSGNRNVKIATKAGKRANTK